MSVENASSARQVYAPEPGWLAAKPGEVFCWYHQPDEPGRKQGIILCDTLGSERMSLHLAYRYLALELCRAGFPVLRVDYHGTADSGGGPREPQRLRAWLDSLHAGCDYLKQRAGVSEITAFGAHFGGTLAALLAAERADVTELVLWGPFLRGRDFLRSAKAFARLAGGNPEKHRPQDWQEGDLEVVGFLHTAETVDSLQAIDLRDALQGGSLQRVCILEWDDHADSSQLVAHCRQQGIEVDYVDHPIDSSEACIQRQAVPRAIIEKCMDFLAPHSEQLETSGCPGNRLMTEVNLTGKHSRDGIAEAVEYSGPQKQIFSIVTRPNDSDRSRGPWIIIVNGGNNHRCGINRNHTEWARSWADKGFTVVRMDIRGLGDSPPQDEANLNRLYRVATRDDIRMIMDSVQARYGIDQFIVGGLCAGAFQAMQAARKDRRVVGLWLVELLRFYHHDHHNPIRRLRKLRRIVADKLKIRTTIFAPPLARWLRNLNARGAKTLVVYQGKQSILEDFLAEAAHAPSQLENCSLHLLVESNHIVSPLHSQDELCAVLSEWLTREVC